MTNLFKKEPNFKRALSTAAKVAIVVAIIVVIAGTGLYGLTYHGASQSTTTSSSNSSMSTSTTTGGSSSSSTSMSTNNSSGTITVAEYRPSGPLSFDPGIDYESRGQEVQYNIFQTLVFYNGSSITSFIPVAASVVPSVQNMGISNEYTTYNFTIRNNQYFSNGDHLTAYDVWFSLVRVMAFTAGSPSTPANDLAQFVIPGVQNGTASAYTNNTWSVVTSAITYSNASNTVAIQFNRVMQPTLVYQVLSDVQVGGIVDATYACSVGACFNATSYSSYQRQANSGSYNQKMQWDPVGSGPYMIQTFTQGQSIELVPNPHYGGVPMIPLVHNNVVIDWETSADTALLMLQNGQADASVFLPTSDYGTLQSMQKQNQLQILNFPTDNIWFYNFNININKTLEAQQVGSGFNEPSNYLADLPTRLTFIDAFDYAGYLNNILGNSQYNTTFASGYQGVIPPGMSWSTPASQLGGLPRQNLQDAMGNFSISAWHNQKITVPIIVETEGGQAEQAAAQELANTLSTISGGNITARPVQMTSNNEFSNCSPGSNAMSVWDTLTFTDYPDGGSYMDELYLETGVYSTYCNSFTSAGFASLAPSTAGDIVHVDGATYNQSIVYQWISGNVSLGDSTANATLKQQAYTTATKLAIDMGLYGYTANLNAFWYWRPTLSGSSLQENPIIGGDGQMLYFWLNKR